MTNDTMITEYTFAGGPQRGSRLTLHAGRLVHHGGDVSEHMPLAQLASLRIEFMREPRKLKWALILLVAALVLYAAAGPLQGLAANAANEVVEHAKREGVVGGTPRVLAATFQVLARIAAFLPTIGTVAAACGVVLLFFFWRGLTLLTLVAGAAERVYAVPGRNRALMAFADTAAERLAELSG